MRPIVLAAALCALIPAGSLRAQASSDPSQQVTMAVRTKVPPVIDGRDDDAAWKDAPANSQFLEFSPTKGKDPRFKTEFKVTYDDRNLYVFIRAFDPHPDSIMTALTRRDVRGPSDQLKVVVDGYRDRRSGFEMAVNPVGVKRDYAMYNDGEEDGSWDGIWDVATRIDSLGWTAEYRIPFSQLRYANKPEQVFGFSIWRDIERFKERTSWPLYDQTKSGFSSQIGELHGIRDIAPFHRREVVPYIVAKTTNTPFTSAPRGAAPFQQSSRISAGADLKLGLTPNLTLDATVNPDFGQVEADPSVVNLTAFESFFQERRPFFVEGTGLYNYGLNCSVVNCNGEGLFYSRRIGRAPQLFGLYADDASPNVSPILGAAKLTGRVHGTLNVGALEAMTGRVEGTGDRTTEPRTNYTVLRAQQDLRRGETSIGFIATGVNRTLDSWSENFLRRGAYAGGSNLRHRWSRNLFEIQASVMASDVTGSAASIASTQRSSVHLYQRPDGRLTYDPTRTSLSGDAEEFSFGKFGGNMVHFQTSYQRQSPGFEINDLGFLRRANQMSFNNWMGLNWNKPTKVYRRASWNFNAWSYWTAAGLRTDQAVNSNFNGQLQNNMFVNGGFTLSQLPGSYCDNCSRGGPAFRRSPLLQWNTGLQGDDRRHVQPSLFVFGGRGDYGASHYLGISPQLSMLPFSQLQVVLSADWSRNTDDSQWFNNFTDAGTGKVHYTFAHLEQETQDIGVRVSYTATPTLSFQLYAAPFVSRGQYTNMRELSATPRADRYADRYTPYTPSSGGTSGFDVQQLRSNSVLRWEFRPGSTLFAVWTHGRNGFDPAFPNRSFTDEYKDLFALHPANTFLVKMAYWLD